MASVCVYGCVQWCCSHEYASSIWSPYLAKDIIAIERVQKFAFRVCLKDWSLEYDEALDLSNLPSLGMRRDHSLVPRLSPSFTRKYTVNQYARASVTREEKEGENLVVKGHVRVLPWTWLPISGITVPQWFACLDNRST